MKFFVCLFLLLNALHLKASSELPELQKAIPTSAELREEISFWSDRFEEHLLYLRQSFILTPRVGALVWLANNLEDTLKNLKKEFQSQGISGKFLAQYKGFLDKLRNYMEMARENTRASLLEVVIALINHMLEELDYHQENIAGKKRSYAEEVSFWKQHDSEVTSLKLLKQSAREDEKRILETLEKLGLEEHEKKEDLYAQTRLARLAPAS